MKIKTKLRKKVLKLFDSGVDLDQVCFRTELKLNDVLGIIKKYRVTEKLNVQLKNGIARFRVD